ncbi:MAG TPA: glycerate kinase [Ramlibacter sp.]|nr:glycerate kinase [Ramlibacter sp.]
MNLQKIITPVLGVILVAAAWRAYGWGGVAIAATGVVMWVLLHLTRLTQVLKRTANHPIGYVGSAVMLNAKLKPGVNLLHVLALTRSLGERLSNEGAQPEIYRWTDAGGSSVTAEFANGKLVKWSLVRPPAEAAIGGG